MAFRLHCDRCLRFIKLIDAQTMKSMAASGKEAICSSCIQAEEMLNKIVEKTQRQVADKVKIIEQELRIQLNDDLKKLAENMSKMEG